MEDDESRGSYSGSRLSRYGLLLPRRSQCSQQGPEYALYVAGRFFRVVSVYAALKYLENASVSSFIFVCTLVSGLVFLVFQRPWRGRPLPKSKVVSTVLNGGLLALSLLLWGKSLVLCGPVRTVLAEYTGAVLGAGSTLALGRGGHKEKKLGGLLAMLLAFYLLSQGWTMASVFPFTSKTSSERKGEAGEVGIWTMSTPVLAGAFQALQRVVARRVSLKTHSKKRLQSITVVSAACFLFPLTLLQLATGDPEQTTHQNSPLSAAWAYVSTIVFGMLMSFYLDSFAEDRLRVHASSLVHFLVTAFSLLVLELLHRMDFSLLGFLVCCSVLGLGIFEASSYQRLERDFDLPYSKKEESTTGNGALDSPYPI